MVPDAGSCSDAEDESSTIVKMLRLTELLSPEIEHVRLEYLIAYPDVDVVPHL
jgi:hypothetical protein